MKMTSHDENLRYENASNEELIARPSSSNEQTSGIILTKKLADLLHESEDKLKKRSKKLRDVEKKSDDVLQTNFSQFKSNTELKVEQNTWGKNKKMRIFWASIIVFLLILTKYYIL